MRAVDWLFRNPRTGRLVIAQWPNPPLGLFLVATGLPRVSDPSGTVRTALVVIAGLGLAWWAGDEVLRGESRFRRLLGAGALAVLVASALA